MYVTSVQYTSSTIHYTILVLYYHQVIPSQVPCIMIMYQHQYDIQGSVVRRPRPPTMTTSKIPLHYT